MRVSVFHAGKQLSRFFLDKGRTLEHIKKEIRLPWFKDWNSVDVKTCAENIEHVFKELTKGSKP